MSMPQAWPILGSKVGSCGGGWVGGLGGWVGQSVTLAFERGAVLYGWVDGEMGGWNEVLESMGGWVGGTYLGLVLLHESEEVGGISDGLVPVCLFGWVGGWVGGGGMDEEMHR